MIPTRAWTRCADKDAGTVEFSPGVVIERAWTVSGPVPTHDGQVGALTARVELGPSGRYEIRWLKAEVPGGSSVSGKLLRSIRVAELLQDVVQPPRKSSGSKNAGKRPRPPRPKSLTPEIKERMREAGPVTETLKMVATIYRTAYAIGASPTKQVAEAFEVPRATADRWVRLARNREFLGPAESGRAAI